MEEKKEVGLLPEPEAVLPPTKNVIGKLTEVETLRMENIVLRSEKMQLLKERLAGDMETLDVMGKSLQEDLSAMRLTVAERLSVKDPTKIRIRKTGEVEEAP